MTAEIKTYCDLARLIEDNSGKLTDDRCKSGTNQFDSCQRYHQLRHSFACKPIETKTQGNFVCMVADERVATFLGKPDNPDWKRANEIGDRPECEKLCRNRRFLIEDNLDLIKSSESCRDCEHAIHMANHNPQEKFIFRQKGSGFDVDCIVKSNKNKKPENLGHCRRTLTERQYREVYLNED